MRKTCALSVVVVASLLAGCSGGGSPGGIGISPSNQAFGSVTSNVVLTQDPVWIRGGSSTVYGLVGDISDSTYYNLEPGVDDTQFIVRDGGELRAIDYDGGYTVHYPQPTMAAYSNLSIDKYGLVYFDTGGGTTLTRLNGQTRTIASMRTGLSQGAAVNFSGTKCVYWKAVAGGIYSSNLNGTGESFLVVPAIDPTQVRYVGDNTYLYVANADCSWLQVSPASPLYFVLATPFGSGSADDTRFAASLADGTVRVVSRGLVTADFAQGAPNTALAMCPDGSRFAVINGAQLRTQNITDGTSNTVSVFEPGTALVWGYLPRNIKLVGVGSNYFTSAAGIATGMKKGVPRSFALWDVQTRTTARLREDSGNVTGGTLVLTAEADRFTTFKYTNDRRGYATGLGMGATTNLVTIVFDDATGKIMTVIPVAVTRSSGKPVVTRNGKDVTITGSFENVYDGEGKNLAPGGATTVTVKGGKVMAR